MGTTLENIIRRITVSAKTDGVDETSAKLRGLAGAQSGVAVASEKTSTSTLSMEKRLNSLQRQLDESYRAEQNLAKANRDLSAAQAQGLITAQRRAELSDLAAKKFNVESAAAGRAAAAYKTLQSVGSSIAAGFAGGFLAGGLSQLPAMIDDVVASLANLNDASETIGVTTSRLQELQYVAGQTGVDQETLNGALEKFSLNLGLAAQGEGKLYDILKANHVLVSGDLTTDLMNYAELVKNARNEQERNLIVTAAFGRSAQEMGRFFADGAEGIAALGVEARLTGAIIDQDLVKQAARLDDEMEKLKPKMEAAGSALAVAFGPAQIWLLEQATVAANQLAFAVDSIGKGKVGDAASVVFGFEGFGDGAHSRYLDNLIKSRQLDMEAGLTPDGADDFYSGFGMREETSRRETHETNAPTLLPPDRDAEASLKAYEKLIETSKKRTDQIMIETEALGMVGTAADLYRNTQTLLNEAEAAGVEMTPQRIEQLTELAEAQTDAQLTLEGLHMEMENRTPWEVMGDEMVRIQDLLDKGKIGWDDYAIGVGKVVEDMVGNYSNGADNVLDNVEKLTDALALEGKEQFEIHKTISIARAVVAGGEAIVNSYNAGTALGGGPLLGAAFAGIAAAATAAQIASIASTTYSSKSPIGAGGSSADAPTGAALQGQTQGTVIQFVGDRNSPTTLGAVESLLARLNDELGVNGKEIVVRYKGVQLMSLARFEKAITDAAGNLITTPGFYFSVRQEDVVGSPIKPAYSDRAGASMLGNPSALVDGVVAFHAAGGPFSLRVYGPGYDKTWHYLAIGTGAEADIDTLLIPGFLFEWETATTEPPTAGCIRADNANLALANKLYVWKSTIAGSDVAARLLALATSTIVLTSTLQGAQTSFYVDSVTDDTTHVELAVSSFAGESTIPAGRVGLQREGAAGAPGAAGAIVGTESIYTSASNSIGVAEAGKTLIANRSSSITFALDAAATLGNRWMAPIKNIGTGSLTIDPNGAEQVDGASTLVVPPGHGGLLVCNATGFRMMFLTPIFVGDSGSGGRAGLVPAPAAGDTAASKYLRADGWSALAAADAAAQEAGSATDRYVTPAVQQRHPSAAKAWAYVTVSGGTPTLQASYNVTSITDTNVGRLTVTIGTDFSSANWAALALLGANTGGAPFVTDESTTTAKTAGSVEILAAQSSTLTDPVAYNFAGFGDQ